MSFNRIKEIDILTYPFDHTRDRYYGHPLTPIELIQYGDFQCENSAAVYPEIKMLQEKMGNQLKFVFRHFPLSAIHPLSVNAAVAAEAAALQGGLSFWNMHDMIFENQKYLGHSSFSRFAEEIELNTMLFEDARRDKKLVQKIASDYESGVKSGVSGTPTFFFNGKKYNGFHDFESFFRTCKYILNFKSLIVE